MSLTYDEIDQYLVYIFSGVKYVDVDDFFLVFKHPTNKIKHKAQFIYNKAFNDAIKDGMLPVKELEELIEKKFDFQRRS